MEVSGRLHASASLPTGEDPWYPLDRRLGGPQSRSGRGGEERDSHPLSEFEHLSHTVCSLALYHWVILASMQLIKHDAFI
jgi:hypothetical protein